jgi:hypothetical protein
MAGIQFPERAGIFLFSKDTSAAYPASYPKDTGALFPRNKVGEA